MTNTRKIGYEQDVLYAGYAGRLYGCSRLITSGTSNPAITGDVKWRKQRADDKPDIVTGPFKFLSLQKSVRRAQVVMCEPDKFGRLQQHPSDAGRQNPGTITMNWTGSREAV